MSYLKFDSNLSISKQFVLTFTNYSSVLLLFEDSRYIKIAVKEAVAEHTSEPFIIGYRLIPEEIHDENIGYTFDDSLYLIDKIADLCVDYIHTSLFGFYGYKKKAQLGQFEG